MKEQSILIEKICNSVLRRRKGEDPITLEMKKERLFVICEKKNLTGSLIQLIQKILNII